jgi:hypothetical protein
MPDTKTPTPENLRWALISVFRDALDKRRDVDAADALGEATGKREDDAIRSQVAAFDLAAIYGWDCEHSESFQVYARGATNQEILAEGLRMALFHCRPEPAARLDCDGCRKTFAADGSEGQLTELTGNVYNLLIASPDSVYHGAHKGTVYCDACILGLVRGLL